MRVKRVRCFRRAASAQYPKHAPQQHAQHAPQHARLASSPVSRYSRTTSGASHICNTSRAQERAKSQSNCFALIRATIVRLEQTSLSSPCGSITRPLQCTRHKTYPGAQLSACQALREACSPVTHISSAPSWCSTSPSLGAGRPSRNVLPTK